MNYGRQLMKLTETDPNRLHDREQRARAKLARIARADCWYGGARALVLADRLLSMGSQIDPHAAVGDAYANTNGNATNYLAYECPECGNAQAGEIAALNCCNY